ncbi:unnamed protein product [Cylindrotheca closterium]|uniref:Kinesin light chain n=1 Tax=Cylindrotheca closterium TaxID=2856 RepID=A0AAD2PY34_9STRA|nr:unnamed protein product [Cylindrotheca closterium]
MEGKEEESVEELIKKSRYCFEKRNNQEAKETLERALAIQRNELGEDDLTVAWILYQIGTILAEEDNFDEAFEKFDRALAIRVEKLGTHLETANSYMSIGVVLESQDNGEKAEVMFREALGIYLEILPRNHSEVMDAYLHLASSLKKQGKLSQATKIHKLRLGTLLQIHGEDHQGVVLSYNGISELLRIQNRLDDALQMIDRAVEICNRLERLGDFDMDLLGRALYNKASILNEQGNFKAATEVFNKVLTIQIEAFGEMHRATALTYENLAAVYIQQGMIEGAIMAYTNAINVRRKELGNDHPDTKELLLTLALLKRDKNITTLNDEGLARNAEGDSEKALQLFHQVLDIYEESSIASPNVAAAYENISTIKVDQGMLEDAIAASAEALKIRRRTLGDGHCDTKRRMEAHRSLLKRLLVSRS